MTCVKIPDGIDDLTVRRRLLKDWGIEIGGGLGPFKGQAWRIGLMGYGSRQSNVTLLLAALETCLRDLGCRSRPARRSGRRPAFMRRRRSGFPDLFRHVGGNGPMRYLEDGFLDAILSALKFLDTQPDLRDLGVDDPHPGLGDLILTFGLADIVSADHPRLPLVETLISGDGVLGHLRLSFGFLSLGLLSTQFQLESSDFISDVFVESGQKREGSKDFISARPPRPFAQEHHCGG